MQLTGKPLIEGYIATHTTARPAFATFVKIIEACNAANPILLKQSFGNYDTVPNSAGPSFYIFNVGGNSHRVIAHINFQRQQVLVKQVLDHTDYEKWSNKQRKNRKKK